MNNYSEKGLIKITKGNFDSNLELLIKQAESARNNAYAPYSKFKVGCAVQFSDDEIVTGSNQENIAYPSGLCAERVALFYAGAKYPEKTIKNILVVAAIDSENPPFPSPCGSCRQVMIEYQIKQNIPINIYLYPSEEDYLYCCENVEVLLPFPFQFSSFPK